MTGHMVPIGPLAIGEPFPLLTWGVFSLPVPSSFFFKFSLLFRMRKAWRDIVGTKHQESNNKLELHHSWFASPLLDLQSDSRTRVRNRGAHLMPPRRMNLDLSACYENREHLLSTCTLLQKNYPFDAMEMDIVTCALVSTDVGSADKHHM